MKRSIEIINKEIDDLEERIESGEKWFYEHDQPLQVYWHSFAQCWATHNKMWAAFRNLLLKRAKLSDEVEQGNKPNLSYQEQNLFTA